MVRYVKNVYHLSRRACNIGRFRFHEAEEEGGGKWVGWRGCNFDGRGGEVDTIKWKKCMQDADAKYFGGNIYIYIA